MQLYVNSKKEFVTLTGKEATNTQGNKYLWVRCANGAVVSILEKDFVDQFEAYEEPEHVLFCLRV